jgi:D-serine deaminase-like pyridoxal phosphate-dependent protein
MASERWRRLEAATCGADAPLAAVDLPALLANADDLRRRAGGKPIRLASKSLRCRSILNRLLALDGFSGVLAFTLPEALWLAADVSDVVVGYPTVDKGALLRLARDELAAERVTLMVDSIEQLDLIDAVAPPSGRLPIRVCVELDASLRVAGGRVHLGARRSPLHSPEEVVGLAREVARRAGFRLVGLMAYEGQIAGVGDRPPGRPVRGLAIRAMQGWSASELRERRAATVAAVSEVARLEFVNGGGTGSLERTGAESVVTELAAGSGLYGPALFDAYRAFRPEPAAFFALSVVRRPGPGVATVLGGGWIASGPPGADRVPVPAWPSALRLTASEGAGEVQTPLVGPDADGLRVGDRVWFRHAKAGELCEHVERLHLVDEKGRAESVPTYRGEGKTFL